VKFNDAVENQRVMDVLSRIRERRAQGPITYKPLLDEALALADALFMRSMAAEARLHKISELLGAP
jgi:hypothetical protein